MPLSSDTAIRWRAKAEEARAIAAAMTDRQARLTMLKIAEGYEHLAGIAERAAAISKFKLQD
jgi:hypothetical protein